MAIKKSKFHLFISGIILFVSLHGKLSGQQIQFSNTWFTSGDHGANKFIELQDSSFLLIGFSDNSINGSPGPGFYMHVDKYGDTIMTRTYYNAVFFSMASNSDSDFVIAGGFTGTQGGIAQLNLMGDSLTFQDYSSACTSVNPGSIEKCPDNGFILACNQSCDFGFLKVDSAFNVQWHYSHNMPYGCWQIIPDPLGGYVAVGNYGVVSNPFAVARLDSSGNQLWLQGHGNVLNPWSDNWAYDAVLTQDSNYLIACAGPGTQLMKLNRITGDTIWTKEYSPSLSDYYILSMNPAGNDKYICAGAKLFLIDGNGNIIWEHNIHIPNHVNRVGNVSKTLDGGFAVCGALEHNIFPLYRIIFFIKTDSLGNTINSSIYDLDKNLQPLTFYPNPATTQLYISPGNLAAEKKLRFTLCDLQGRVFLNQKYDDSKPVDVSSLPEGVYIATLKGKDKEIRGKVIVQH